MAHITTYRGHRILTVTRQGCVNYYTPAFGVGQQAATLDMIKRWIDTAIAQGEIKERA